MTAAQDIVSKAYREINVTAVGTTPSTAQATEGLDRLNEILHIIFGSEMGELLQDWQVPSPQRTAAVAANFPQLPYPLATDPGFLSSPLSSASGRQAYPYPPKNSRIVFAGTGNMTVWFPEQPDDGSRMGIILGANAPAGVVLTLDGNGRKINGLPTQTLTTPFTAQRWMYRADLGDWRPVADLAATDALPFPKDMEAYFITRLAIRLAPANDKTVSGETADAYKQAKTIFEARYKQAGTTTFGSNDIPRSYESYQGGRYGWWP
jgi:hypothetical protein